MLPEQCCLKIIAVNDVYKIDQWPHFATCLRKESEPTQENVKIISVLPGDFLAPSLLSSIDKGEKINYMHTIFKSFPFFLFVCRTRYG